MKKLLILSAAAVAPLLLASHASAAYAPAQPTVADPSPAVIGVQFDPYYSNQYNAVNNTLVQGYALNPAGYQAGALNQQYWNVANGQTGVGNGTTPSTIGNSNLTYDSNGTYTTATGTLMDSNGAPTSVQFQLSNLGGNDHTAVNTNQPGSTPTPFAGGAQWYAQNGATDSYLVSGVYYSQSTVNPVTLSFAGLNDSDYYDVYAYVSGTWWTGSQLAQVTLGNQSFYLKTDNGTLANYTLGTAGSAGSATMADYVEFTNVLGSNIDLGTGGSDSLTVTGTGGAVGLSGFQLQDIGSTPAAVPEPSTVWMFSLGFLGLMVHVYRRRCAQV